MSNIKERFQRILQG